MSMSDTRGAEDLTRARILEVLHGFQEGYRLRDVGRAGQFIRDLFSSCDDVIVVGTSAVERGGYEWCEGPEQVRRIVEEDWRSWGDLTLDMEGAHISWTAEAAWVSTVGVLRQVTEQDRGYMKRPTSHEAPVVSRSPELRTGDTEEGIWPLRWSAVLIREEGRWRFHQMHFSYPGQITPQHPHPETE